MSLLSPWLRRGARTALALATCSIRSATRPLATASEPAIKLRPYQEECIQAVLSCLSQGHKRLGISLATGSGKTIIFTQLIDRLKAPNSHATQTLIIVHRRELVEQAAHHCRAAYPDKSIEIEMNRQHASGAADITVASINSLRLADRLDKFNPRRFKLVLVDETHHIVAKGYLDVLEHFGLYIKPPSRADAGPRLRARVGADTRKPTVTFQPDAPALVGVSATFSRFDGVRLGAAIDYIAYHRDYIDMINDKWLSPVSFTTVQSKADLGSVKTSKGSEGDFQIRQLSHAVNTAETNEITFAAWQSEAAANCKSTLIFCVDINHVKDLTSTFRRHGIDARYITGTTKQRERSVLLQEFKDRAFPVLLNCAVFTEGTDMPNIDCVVLARPTKSRNLLVQMIGRGMRLYEGKTNCHIIDMVASLESGIVTVPTLFGLDPAELLTKAKAVDLKKAGQEQQEHGPVTTPTRDVANDTLSFTHYSSVQDLIKDTSGERHVRALSPFAWVQLDSNKYILTARGGILTIEQRRDLSLSSSSSSQTADSDSFVAVWKYPLPPGVKSKSPLSKPRVVASAATLANVLRAADTFAATKFPRVSIASRSAWRRAPASEGQLAFLNKLRLPLTPADLTKGQAADMITKIKFGARGRFDKLQSHKRRVQREKDRSHRLDTRERVTVGPVEM
ncbi:hypothetical protein DV735_g1406, partial [Chaetothyriales sp. CBS 134920]